jgi:hypothetical protein
MVLRVIKEIMTSLEYKKRKKMNAWIFKVNCFYYTSSKIA